MSTITREFTKEQLLSRAKARLERMQEAMREHSGSPDACMDLRLAEIALASLEAEAVAYIFKHPAGRLFWALTDESNKGQSDVMPVYSTPAPAFVPPAIEPDYEVIKGILPTANPDEYACYIAADMWNACRAAMLQGAEPVTTGYKLPFDKWLSQQYEPVDVDCGCVTTEAFNHWLRVAYEAGNSPVIPDSSEDTKRLDWLDAQNKRLNEYYGTTYGWKFDANFQRNAMMLNDSNYPVMTVRQAIDEAIAAAPQQEVKP